MSLLKVLAMFQLFRVSRIQRHLCVGLIVHDRTVIQRDGKMCVYIYIYVDSLNKNLIIQHN